LTDERRYSDEEVEEIFRSAASDPVGRHGLPAREGLTIADLQAIGREVGMSPEQIAAAAARLDRRSVPAPRSTVLGMPIGVGRTVDLPRAPTDREWSILVTELREIFAAHGREGSAAGIRSWNNGQLRVVIEPTESGYRLRMRTRKTDAMPMMAVGLLFVLLAILSLLGAEGAGIGESIFMALAGMGALSFNAVRLSSWASVRSEQMERIAARTVDLLSRAPADALPGGEA
jgi:hypothetical protein